MVELVDNGWFSGDDTWGGRAADQAQNDAIRSLNSELVSARRKLSSELRHIRGSLEQRIDRISASFDAFVELSDVRAVLAMFDEPALVRHRTRQLVAGSPPAEVRLENAPGYWLAPAAHGLAAALDGDAGTARARFADAAKHDPLRAGVFVLLSVPAADASQAPALADWILPKLLPELPTEVNRYQRALWLLTADGFLGEDARELLRLQAAARQRDSADDQGGQAAWQEIAPSGTAPPLNPRFRIDLQPLQAPLTAAARLSGLRQWVEAAVTAEEEPASPDPVVEETLRLLVDEGTPEEAPLLDRAARLRSVIESNGTGTADIPAPTWSDPVGNTAELLRADAADPSAPAARRAFSISVHAPHIVAAAETLARQAREPAPDRTSLKSRGGKVAITPQGPEPDSLLTAEKALEHQFAPDRVSRTYAGIAAAVGLVSLGVGAATATAFFWAAGIAALAAAGWLLYRDRQSVHEAGRSAMSQQSRLRSEAEGAANEWRALLGQAADGREQAAADLAAIRRLLTVPAGT